MTSDAESIESRIVAARGGDLIIGNRTWNGGSVEGAAAEFGLFSSPGIYIEVSALEAESVLRGVLHRDMAYESCELVPLEEAARLAAEFIRQFSFESAKFYTNGEYGRPRVNSSVGWTPATTATFDTGVLMVSPDRIACAWFMDED